MKRISSVLLLTILVLLAYTQRGISGSKSSRLAQAAEVFALINNYRAENGLSALQSHSILYQTAQAQSDYQASISQITHGGPTGNRPIERAYAAGYGDGQIIFISELITGGSQQGADGALTWWKNSSEHNFYLLHADYIHLGIGVANDASGRSYYTAVMGHIATGTTYTPSSIEEAAAVEAQPIIIPVVREEARSDGAIVHIVRTGQAMWNIAAVYEISLEMLYDLNNLNVNSFIFPGDEIIIQEATEITISADPTPSAASPTQQIATPSLEVRPSPTAGVQLAENQNFSDSSAENGAPNTNIQLVITTALAAIGLVVLATLFLGSSTPKNGDSDE
jgi:uncharacterized protein YkwD